MNILYITSGKGMDYLNDTLFHGLVRAGNQVTDSTHIYVLDKELTKLQKQRLYGRGFTTTGLLENRRTVDRTNIKEKIENKVYDCIIYGSIWRCRDYIDTVLKCYPKEKIAFVDGEDHNRLYTPLLNKGLYFKRLGLTYDTLPISFSYPELKIVQEIGDKKDWLAFYIPGMSYAFTDETEYYKMYNTSFFGSTRKKGGWDCMRHYLIIGSNCLPYFEDWNRCPGTIMTDWPSRLQAIANNIYKTKDEKAYSEVLAMFREYMFQHLLTTHQANYVLNRLA